MINTARLDQMVSELRDRLGGGLLATDVWERDTKRSLANHNGQPAGVEMMNRLTDEIDATLRGSNFPPMSRYFLLELDGEKAVLIIRHGDDLLQGLLLDTRYTNMGIVLSLGLRTAENGVIAARNG